MSDEATARTIPRMPAPPAPPKPKRTRVTAGPRKAKRPYKRRKTQDDFLATLKKIAKFYRALSK
jgi:hypothetical protein